MDSYKNILDTFFFSMFPYIIIFTFLLVTIQRYRAKAYTFSSLSSQFLENKQHFWAMIPFHYGIIAVLAAHFVWFLVPDTVLWWNRVPARLYVMEIAMFIFGLMTLIGLINIIIRRQTNSMAKVVTSKADWWVLGFLTIQVVTGLYIAYFYRWGSSWFAASLTPYLWSVIKLSPDLTYISAMPFMVKAHIVSAYSIILLFPFTRLVHALVVPNPYLWRKPQVVRWYWNRKKIRSSKNL
ncbi:MAG: respiratory nitrate reductase subunit gamma [Candidatus Marinimicrobia bacterium]|jgi:nitrate reductase gamma subunit|nr:respiratory nitrate reductase subunit gamma [Candidatus Neomarinimicrobiota bacterium]MBT3947300.1 respiratory nitrate reductase subunit gamma [Candidatus Neomarinimicrobiota bacterium]MBT4063768.1 respiratory nitrate reductase subunit gamma [Candidatus Neomarinimicrobiota bacterium]MBT4307764.1 respiratory nitrate reductase subunit gamma [Candidatus Neomarinimicrobiota bacterium]MBT4453357.1 respiratory nitrate reductase subunit gamma [Candidatus Neomarinimicrobiota bacterium]|tara:strand:+ start:86 stop:799 length:714 start_codon:yes stop_codon:yes gene_type:complete